MSVGRLFVFRCQFSTQVHGNPFGGEVFSKFVTFERTAELLFPPLQVLNGVGVDSFGRPSVRLAIG